MDWLIDESLHLHYYTPTVQNQLNYKPSSALTHTKQTQTHRHTYTANTDTHTQQTQTHIHNKHRHTYTTNTDTHTQHTQMHIPQTQIHWHTHNKQWHIHKIDVKNIHNKHKCTCTTYTNDYTTNTYIHTHNKHTTTYTTNTDIPTQHSKLYPQQTPPHRQNTQATNRDTNTTNTYTKSKKTHHCIFHTYIYTLLVWVSVCLSVRLYPINVKTAEPIGPNFLWDLMWPQGRFMDNRIFKNLPPSKFFVKIREISVCFCFTMSKREHVHNWNGRIVEIYYIISIE